MQFVLKLIFRALIAAFVSLAFLHLARAETPTQWLKGNLHTHSLWSDGDDYPEMIVDWYKTNGYQFLVLSDHNVLQEQERWTSVATNKGGTNGFARYVKRFGTNWVEQRQTNGATEVRLKTFPEFRKLFEEPKNFLLMPGEEISDRHLSAIQATPRSSRRM